MKKILIISFKDLVRGVRVRRQVKYLADKYDVYTVGYAPAKIKGEKFFALTKRFEKMGLFRKALVALLLLLRQFRLTYGQMYGYQHLLKELKGTHFDLIIVHDLFPLPLTYMIDPHPNILLDAHEYFYDQGKESIMKKILSPYKKHLLTTYFEKLDHFLAVSEGIAQAFEQHTGKNFHVIANAHEFAEMFPCQVNEKKIRIIHHGVADKSRRVDLMVQMMDAADERFSLDLMLVANTFDMPYLNVLKKMSEERSNVNLLPPVAPDEIVKFINQYDIGLFLLPDTYFTHAYSLPNKFFEFVQARLCIAIGPSFEMAKIARQYDLGIVADDFSPSSMAKAINSLTREKIEYYKNQCHRHAKTLSADTEMKKLEAIIEKII